MYLLPRSNAAKAKQQSVSSSMKSAADETTPTLYNNRRKYESIDTILNLLGDCHFFIRSILRINDILSFVVVGFFVFFLLR